MPSTSRKISQAQIARDLGVSQALVSLVLNGRRDGINPATYERIWQHTALTGYRAKGMNPAAAAAASLPPQVGIILSSSLSLARLGNYFSHVQSGLHAGLAELGGSAVFLGGENGLAENHLKRIFKAGHYLHGLVLLGETSLPFLESILHREHRVVSICTRHAGFGHTVNGDERTALSLIVRHLHELGHRRIGWLGGRNGSGRHETRFDAFRAALVANGLSSDPHYETTHINADRAEGAEAIHRLLPNAHEATFPSAFVCYNSLMAVGATLALTRAGWNVPGEISFVGADLPRTATQKEPSVTGAGTCPESLGRAAAELLLAPSKNDDKSYQHLTLPVRLIIGETSGRAPITALPRHSSRLAGA